MSEPIWKLIKDPITNIENIVYRKWENGREDSCLITDLAYLKWVAEGNTPLPADNVTA